MAKQDDEYGLMPALSMGPSGYIPPAAATLASGLAGITAQQSALQKQLAQEQEQRRKEFEAERERRGQAQLSLGQTLEDPKMLASGASAMLGMPIPETQFQPFVAQKAQARNAALFETLLKAKLSKKSAARLIPLILGPQLQQASPATPAPATAAPPVPVPAPMPEPAGTETVVMPDVIPTPPALTTGAAPATATTATPAETPLTFMGVPLEFSADAPDDALTVTAKNLQNEFNAFDDAGVKNRLPPKVFNNLNRQVRTLKAEAQAAYNASDLEALTGVYSKLLKLTYDLGPTTGAAPYPGVKRQVGSKFVTDTVISIDPITGRSVSVETIAGATPMTPQEQMDMSLRQYNARLDGARLKIAERAENRQERGQILSALEKRFPAFKLTEIESQAASELREQLKFEFPIVQNNPVLTQQNLAKQSEQFAARYQTLVNRKIDEGLRGLQADPNAAAWLDNYLVSKGVLPKEGRVVSRTFSVPGAPQPR